VLNNALLVLGSIHEPTPLYTDVFGMLVGMTYVYCRLFMILPFWRQSGEDGCSLLEAAHDSCQRLVSTLSDRAVEQVVIVVSACWRSSRPCEFVIPSLVG
jgi:ABC-type spermidine/putrescine transport system permease subunit I